MLLSLHLEPIGRPDTAKRQWLERNPEIVDIYCMAQYVPLHTSEVAKIDFYIDFYVLNQSLSRQVLSITNFLNYASVKPSRK